MPSIGRARLVWSRCSQSDGSSAAAQRVPGPNAMSVAMTIAASRRGNDEAVPCRRPTRSAADCAADTIGSRPFLELATLPAQFDKAISNEPIGRSMDSRHHVSPTVFGRHRARYLARTDRRARRACVKESEDYGSRCHDVCRRARADRPAVIGSGFEGGCQSGGGDRRWRLVSRPIAPGRGRVSPEVSANSASTAEAPPRIRLILSRFRRASSKSRARAAASILCRNVSIVSVIVCQRSIAVEAATAPPRDVDLAPMTSGTGTLRRSAMATRACPRWRWPAA